MKSLKRDLNQMLGSQGEENTISQTGDFEWKNLANDSRIGDHLNTEQNNNDTCSQLIQT